MKKNRNEIYIRLPFFQKTLCVDIYQKIGSFYKRKVLLCYNLENKNIRSLFNLKDKTSHTSSVVYEWKCNCGKNYIGEKGRNVTIRWDQHSDIGKNSEPTKYLNQFPEPRFNWKFLRKVPNKVRQRKIQEAYYVMCLRPTLNNQLQLTSLTLFGNGVA